MLVVADRNIPLALEAFSPFGEVHLKEGRELSRADLTEADALIVRSVTKVCRELLEGTPVRFVGTATIGTDHVDLEFVRQAGIAFASAAGANARSVVEWTLVALAEYCVAKGTTWEGRTLGIVGHGNIGSRLAVRARGLGMKVLVNDPPLARREEGYDFVALDELLRQCDFLTLHVPLTREGDDPTWHLISREQLAAMRPGAVLLNSARGPVLDNPAALQTDHLEFILDVFEGEPRPNKELVRRAFLATPHIAGYSHDGKVNGTQTMALALARHLRRHAAWVPSVPPPPDNSFSITSTNPMEGVLEAMRHSYPIRRDDASLREGLDLPDEQWGSHFDALRRNYPPRREFANYRIAPPPADPKLRSWLRVLHLL